MRQIRYRQAIFKGDKFHHWHYWGFCGYRSEFVGPLTITGINNGYEITESQAYICSIDIGMTAVYEGDIVRAYIYSDEEPQELTVQWLGSGFVIEYEDSESDIVLISEFVGSIEIIGNIYENPEWADGVRSKNMQQRSVKHACK